MSRRLLGAALLAGGACLLLPGLGIAQAPPIQTDPQAGSHVLRLPPSYNPATPSDGGSRYDAPQYRPYGGQPQQPPAYQGNGSPAPRYGTSLLGAPNFQAPGYGAPLPYGSDQSASLRHGTAQPAPAGQAQPGSGIPPVQSPTYAPPPGDGGPYGSVAQPNPYARPDSGAAPYGSQDPSITQEPLTPLPGTAPPPAQAQQQQPNGQPPAPSPGVSQPSTPQSSSPAQLATPNALPDTQGATGSPPAAGAEAEKNPAPELPNIWLPAGVAKLQALDKVNAQASTLSVKVGQSVTFGSLTITVKSCVIRPTDQPADAAAFVDVTDSHPDFTGFSGWLLENEPAVSIMQHPIYDLRVTGCA